MSLARALAIIQETHEADCISRAECPDCAGPLVWNFAANYPMSIKCDCCPWVGVMRRMADHVAITKSHTSLHPWNVAPVSP